MMQKILFLIFIFFAHQLSFALAEENFDSIEFIKWKNRIIEEFSSKGIPPSIITTTLAKTKINKKVLNLYNKQPEKIYSFKQYINKVISTKRISLGKKLLLENKKNFQIILKKHKVQSRFINAIWGLETNYGSFTGGFNTISALTTLAYASKRKKFYTNELFYAFYIINKEQMNPELLQGSWAGAMGQSQFMPSSYVNYAIDGNNDKRIDIWHNKEDVFASIANYLKKHGWNYEETWGREILLPKNFDMKWAGLEVKKNLKEWKKLGITNKNGTDLPVANIIASIVIPDKNSKRAFIVYNNFRSILKYNNSVYYALSVGILSDSFR